MAYKGPDAARAANIKKTTPKPKASSTKITTSDSAGSRKPVPIKVSQVTVNDILNSVKKGGMKDLQSVIALNRGGRGQGARGPVAGGSATAEFDEAFRRLYPKQWKAIVTPKAKPTAPKYKTADAARTSSIKTTTKSGASSRSRVK